MTSVNVNIEKDNSATVTQRERDIFIGECTLFSFAIPLLAFIGAMVFFNYYDMQEPAPKMYRTSPEPLGLIFWHATSVFGGFLYMVMLFMAFGGAINMHKVGEEITTYSNGKVIVTDIKEHISDLEIKRNTIKGKGISVALRACTSIATIYVIYVVVAESFGLGKSYDNLGFFGSIGAIAATIFGAFLVGFILSIICGLINEKTARESEYTYAYGILGTTILQTYFWLVTGVVLHKFIPASYNFILGFFS